MYTLLALYVPQDNLAATPLITACFDNHPQVARYLISKGARVNYQQKVIHHPYCLIDLFTNPIFSPQKGYTSLHAASLDGHTTVVQLLINSKAKLDIKDNVSLALLVAHMSMVDIGH